MQKPEDQFHQLIFPLYSFMQSSGEAYKKYAANKVYGNAEAIWASNKNIYDLLVSKNDFIPGVLQDDIPLLFHHYDGWFTQFRDHKERLNPSPGDQFVFHRTNEQAPYPRQVEEKIFRYYEAMKRELDAGAVQD